MNRVFILLLAISVCSFSYAGDKMSKKEKKKIKKELKQYKKNPESYVNKIDGYEEEIADFEEEVDAKNALVSERDAQLTLAGEKIGELAARVLELEEELANADCASFPEGTAYRVQIGLYEFFNIEADLDNTVRTLLLENVDGQNRYSIGNFSSVEEAAQFKKDMRAMGIKDAFVSEYINGERNMEFDELAK